MLHQAPPLHSQISPPFRTHPAGGRRKTPTAPGPNADPWNQNERGPEPKKAIETLSQFINTYRSSPTSAQAPPRLTPEGILPEAAAAELAQIVGEIIIERASAAALGEVKDRILRLLSCDAPDSLDFP